MKRTSVIRYAFLLPKLSRFPASKVPITFPKGFTADIIALTLFFYLISMYPYCNGIKSTRKL